MPVNIWEGSDASVVAAALEAIAQSTGGRISSYNDLTDKPQIGGVELSGNKSLDNLGIHNIPSGGTTGQVLKKTSWSNYAVGWADESGGGADIDDTAGHGATTKVWSAGKTYDTTNALSSAIIPQKDSTKAGVDLDFSDENGKVILRMAGGGVETKQFKGFTYKKYVSETEEYTNATLTLTVHQKFVKGDRIVIHVERNADPWDEGAIVSYYADERAIRENWRGDCSWIVYDVTEDVENITAVYTANAYLTSGTDVTLEVSLLGDVPIKPTVVTIKQDGSGDFDNFRDALEDIGKKANDVLNPYRIEVYPGTYDVLDDYTQAEIEAADFDNKGGFCGVKLLNGMYLVGIGLRNEIIINGSLSTTTYSQTIREKISTINTQGSCGLENLTIIAENLRYVVHDDFYAPFGKQNKRIVKNCVFRGYGSMSQVTPITYGAGTSFCGIDAYFEDCDFGTSFGIHSSRKMYNPSRVHLMNCKATQVEFGDIEYLTTKGSELRIDGCSFGQVRLYNFTDDPYTEAHTSIVGNATGMLYTVPDFALYNTGDVTMISNLSLSPGDLVEYKFGSNRFKWQAATSLGSARGVVIGTDGTDCYIQKSGCVNTNRLGITGFSLGTLIGMDNGAMAIVQNEADAIGRVVAIDSDGDGYVELKWR